MNRSDSMYGLIWALMLFCSSYSTAQADAPPVPARAVGEIVEQRALAIAKSRAKASNPYAVMLVQPETTSVQQARNAAISSGVRPKTGFPRDIELLKTPEAVAKLVPWEALVGGGHIASISVSSPDAAGVRLGLVIEALPVEAMLRFYAQANKRVIDEISGREILAILKRNIDSGDLTEGGRTYWTPKIVGTESSIEIELPPGISTQSVRISIPRLTHLFILPQVLEQRQMERAAASCNLDVSCYSTPWSDTKKSVALMDFVEAGYSYSCTGTLLNDRAASNIPFFLSANHCVSDQTTASTLETVWFYHSSSCNNDYTNASATTVTGGATLLYNTTATDTSFLKLNRAAPSGAKYAGWWPGLPALGTDMVGIHHPTGDKQKISFGYLADYASCTISTSDGDYSCSSASSSTANYLELVWRQGITETGSSGSGVWAKHSDGNYYLVGQLWGGASDCSTPSFSDTYGRFDRAYNAALKKWLEAPAVTYAMSVSIAGSGTVTSTPTGINCGIDCTENYNSGASVTLTATSATGYTFSGWSGACLGTAATCTVTMVEAKAVSATFRQVTEITSGADCVFNWAEQYYPELFSPSGANSKTFGSYYYRYYASTDAYLGNSNDNSHIYYVGPLSRQALLDVGAMSAWMGTAGCSQ
jgi:lysyl endopeptidase